MSEPIVQTKLRVAPLGLEDEHALAEFCAGRADTTVFHTWAWHRVIQQAYGHGFEYWGARRDDSIVGVFPVTTVRLPLVGSKAVCMPYQLHSGLPVADETEVQRELVRAALERSSAAGVDYFEIRHHEPAPWLEEMGFRSLDSGLVTTTVPLKDLDLRNIRRNHRRNLRDAWASGVDVVEGKSIEDLRRFRKMYLRESRELGAPQAGWRFFDALYRIARPFYRLWFARADDAYLGAMLTLDDGKTVFARYAAYSSPLALARSANKVLYWHAMADAAERGCDAYNCGISWTGDSGLVAWKEGWNGTSRPVYVYVYPVRKTPPPPGGYFDGYRLAKAVWRRLPLPIVDRLGHQVTRWIC